MSIVILVPLLLLVSTIIQHRDVVTFLSQLLSFLVSGSILVSAALRWRKCVKEHA